MTGISIHIARTGPGNTIQDGGRLGWLRFGVTPAGPMDWIGHALANAMAGNSAGAAAIEITIGGIEVELRGGAVTLAVAAPGFSVQHNGKAVARHVRLDLHNGDQLAIRPGAHGMWGYIAIAARLDLPLVMGSLATHTRSALGGIDGRALASGDQVTLADPRLLGDAELAAPVEEQTAEPIRVVLGPQADYFSEDGIRTFLGEPFALTAQMDRMAYRLAGPLIAHAKGFNIVSDGIALGAIQVPGNGQPIVLMADRQPTGGYPKIATIIRADMARFAQVRAGGGVRFAATSVAAATAELRRLKSWLGSVSERITVRRAGPIDPARLLETNLIDGVVSATADDTGFVVHNR